MKILRLLKWSPILMAGVFVIAGHGNAEFDKPIKLHPEYLKKHQWISVDDQGNPRVVNHQTCKLIFSDNHAFELRKTFEFSGSTFRMPGKYYMQDSSIKLKNLAATQTIGKAYISGDCQLCIQWNQCEMLYGEGIETFRIKKSYRESSNSFKLAARLLNYLDFN